jgi:hypothetical protein
VESGYPTTADEIDALWLTDALAERHPGVVATSVEVLERHDLTNAHARVAVTYADPERAAASGAPATAFCKLAPTDERRAAILATGMGLREARFYRDLADRVELPVPRAHVARHDDESGLFVLVLEDLVASGALVSDGTWGIPADAVAPAFEALARLHARFADASVRSAEASWVPVLGAGSDYGKVMLRYGIEHHRDRLTDAFVAVSDVYCERTAELHSLWQQGPRTVIHGDPHLGNLYLTGGDLGFLDWGIVNAGPPMRDIGYLMTMAMDVDERRTHERDLLRVYLGALAAEGGPDLGVDEAWTMHRLHAAYTVPASCQVVTFPEGMSDARRVFSDAFLARCQACLEDLEVLDALAEHGLLT